MDKSTLGLIAGLLLVLVGVCGHADGLFDYSTEDWREGVIIECDYAGRYTYGTVGNGLIGYRCSEVYHGTYQTLVIALPYGYTLSKEYRLPRLVGRYNLPAGTKVKFRPMKRFLDRNVSYYEIERL